MIKIFKVLVLTTVLALCGCNFLEAPKDDKQTSSVFNKSNYIIVSKDHMQFSNNLTWIEEEKGTFKNNDYDGKVLLSNLSGTELNLRVDLNIDSRSSGDYSGICLIQNPAGPNPSDGYYYLYDPMYARYKFIKVFNGVEEILETDTLTENYGLHEYVSLEIIIEKKLDNQGITFNEFQLYSDNKKISTLRDREFSTWTMGFGKYKWSRHNDPVISRFKNISTRIR